MSQRLWDAPRPVRRISAEVEVPGSKSITNRALVLAALAQTPSTLWLPLRARDTELMVAGLRALGATVDDYGPWHITPPPWFRGGGTIDCGLAGTVMRFLPVVAGLADGDVHFDGDAAARGRPMGTLINALRTLGVEVTDDGRGTLPFTVHGRGAIRGGELSIDASASSQFVSALLLAAPRFDKGLDLRHVGGPVPSHPHIAMTMAMVADFGAYVSTPEPDVWRVEPEVMQGRDLVIEPDLSNAAPFFAAAVVTTGRVTVQNWPAESTQPGLWLPHGLELMGGECVIDGDGLEMNGSGRVYGVDLDLHDVGELTPVLTAVAALAENPTRFRGIAHLRGHETDRLAALALEINKLGGDVVETADGLNINPRPLHGGVFSTYDDHRMAQAGAVLGLAVDGVQIENVGTTAKTLPDFVERWQAMLRPPPGY